MLFSTNVTKLITTNSLPLRIGATTGCMMLQLKKKKKVSIANTFKTQQQVSSDKSPIDLIIGYRKFRPKTVFFELGVL